MKLSTATAYVVARLARPFYPVYLRTFGRLVRALFHIDLIRKTDNFRNVTWLGNPVWQNILDLWTIQETIYDVRPGLLIETGTNRGGSAMFYAHLFDLLGQGSVLTIDVEETHEISHPRVRFLRGSSTDPETVRRVREVVAAADGPVMVILDSDHSESHVRRELALYAPLVTPGSFLLVQDGVIDRLVIFRGRPGPLPAIREFLAEHQDFEVDHSRTQRFLITHHPLGWLRRIERER